jgi:hypothetical protein
VVGAVAGVFLYLAAHLLLGGGDPQAGGFPVQQNRDIVSAIIVCSSAIIGCLIGIARLLDRRRKD